MLWVVCDHFEGTRSSMYYCKVLFLAMIPVTFGVEVFPPSVFGFSWPSIDLVPVVRRACGCALRMSERVRKHAVAPDSMNIFEQERPAWRTDHRPIQMVRRILPSSQYISLQVNIISVHPSVFISSIAISRSCNYLLNQTPILLSVWPSYPKRRAYFLRCEKREE